jgi:hypothetical protein
MGRGKAGEELSAPRSDPLFGPHQPNHLAARYLLIFVAHMWQLHRIRPFSRRPAWSKMYQA